MYGVLELEGVSKALYIETTNSQLVSMLQRRCGRLICWPPVLSSLE